MHTVNLADKFSKFQDHFNPRVLGEINDFVIKAVKLKGEFIWHHHEHEDEMFLVVKGTLRMKFRTHEAVVREGEFVIVPRRRAYARSGRRGAYYSVGAKDHSEHREYR